MFTRVSFSNEIGLLVTNTTTHYDYQTLPLTATPTHTYTYSSMSAAQYLSNCQCSNGSTRSSAVA